MMNILKMYTLFLVYKIKDVGTLSLIIKINKHT